MGLIALAKSRIREAAKRGNKIAQKLTGEGPRSPHWPMVEKRWKKMYPYCAACGSTIGIQVHHAKSFATHPELELEDCSGIPPGTGKIGGEPNLISLCERAGSDHHLEIGHGGSFEHGGYNPNVVKDAFDLKSGGNEKEIYLRAKLARITPPIVRKQ